MKAAKSSFRKLSRGVVAAALVAFGCAGCASRAAVNESGGLPDGAVDTGTYPNLNVPPPVATQTFDPASLRAHNQAIVAARTGQNQEGQNAAALAAQGRAEQARLRGLAASQRAETAKAVKAQPDQAALQRARSNHAAQAREAAAAAASRTQQERARRLAETSRAAAKRQEASPDQKARDAAIQGARARQVQAGQGVTSTAGLSPAERERLRKLAAARQAETLKAIERQN